MGIADRVRNDDDVVVGEWRICGWDMRLTDAGVGWI